MKEILSSSFDTFPSPLVSSALSGYYSQYYHQFVTFFKLPEGHLYLLHVIFVVAQHIVHHHNELLQVHLAIVVQVHLSHDSIQLG